MSVDVDVRAERAEDQKKIDEKIKDIKKMDIFNCGDDHFSFVYRESESSSWASRRFTIKHGLPEIKIPLAKTENGKKTSVYFKIDTYSDIMIKDSFKDKKIPISKAFFTSSIEAEVDGEIPVDVQEVKSLPNSEYEKEEVLEKDTDKKIKPVHTVYTEDHLEHDSNAVSLIQHILKRMVTNKQYDLPSLSSEDKGVIGLLYSGGKDSTCRLIELLEQGETVYPIVNTFNATSAHSNIQRELSTYQLFDIWKCVGKGKLLRPHFITSISYHFGEDGQTGFSQQQHNAFSLSLLSANILKKFKRIEFCLVNGDQGISWIDDIKRVYKDCMKFNAIDFIDHCKIPPLTFPYTKLMKCDIYHKLIEFNDRYRKYFEYDNYLFAPSCQQLEFSKPYVEKHGDGFYLCFISHPCGRCGSCKRMVDSPLVELTDIEFSIHLIPNVKLIEKETKEIDVLKNCYIISSGVGEIL